MDVNVGDYVTTDSPSIPGKFHKTPLRVIEVDENSESLTTEAADGSGDWTFGFEEITSVNKGTVVESDEDAHDDYPIPKDTTVTKDPIPPYSEDTSGRLRDDMLRHVFGGNQ